MINRVGIENEKAALLLRLGLHLTDAKERRSVFAVPIFATEEREMGRPRIARREPAQLDENKWKRLEEVFAKSSYLVVIQRLKRSYNRPQLPNNLLGCGGRGVSSINCLLSMNRVPLVLARVHYDGQPGYLALADVDRK